MADYDFRPGGSLRLKTGVADGGVKKKKKTKAKPDKGKDRELVKEDGFVDDTNAGSSNSASDPSEPPVVSGPRRKTEAERRFEEVQRQRRAERVAKLANKTHKDRVHEFNAKLEALSEHHDIPKVGPG